MFRAFYNPYNGEDRENMPSLLSLAKEVKCNGRV
nr:MAG TPA: hypothetical protein [Caudoviricetes sp.]